MPEIWEAGRKEELLRRLDALRPEMRPQWGQFTPSRMLEHCAGGIAMALGELPVKPKSGPLRMWPLPKLVIHVLPWPKGAPTAPELLPQGDPDFAGAKAKLQAALERVVKAGPGFGFADHAAFGKLSGPDWGALMYRHLDHHWKQFGL